MKKKESDDAEFDFNKEDSLAYADQSNREQKNRIWGRNNRHDIANSHKE